MRRFVCGASRTLCGLLALGSVVLGSGCDWLKGSEMGQRSSPFLSRLRVEPSSVLCDTNFTVSFNYDDPQGDIYQVRLRLQKTGEATVIDEEELWPEDISKASGTASFDLSFPCDSPGGGWDLTVTVQDDLSHTSNVLTGSVTLNVAG